MNPGKADATVLRRHLLALTTAVTRLRRYRERPLESLTADVENAWAVERGLQLCAQNALDIATHLVAAAGFDAPDYASAIDRLADMAVLPRAFAARFRGVAGFRNVLVHSYLEVDLGEVHRLLKEGLDDFDDFAGYVEQYLASTAS